MLLSIAWKNIWRNKVRSLVVIFAVMIGLLAGSFGVAVMEGMAKKRAKTAIYNEISHVQIHHPEFNQNYESKYCISNADTLISELNKDPRVTAVTSRMILSGMLNTSGGNTSAFVYGIDPEIEKLVTEIYTFVKDSGGTYLDGSKKNQVLISETTAKKLKLDRYVVSRKTLENMKKAGFPDKGLNALKSIAGIEFRNQKLFFDTIRSLTDSTMASEYEFLLTKHSVHFKNRAKIVITFLDSTGHITGDNFSITGIYKTSNRMFDEMSVFVNKNDLADLTGFSAQNPHEIAFLLNDRKIASEYAKELGKKYPNLKIESWGEIDPMIVMLADYMAIYNYFMIAVILAALAFGILNTMLMAVMERTKELGMLAAIGMNRKRVFSMIMIETVFLTIVGALVGLALNSIMIAHFNKTGIDLTKMMGEAFEAIGFDSMIYPEMSPIYYFGITMLVILAAVLSSIYPAIKAIKLNPAEAVRTDA
jgi:ABC-type lipoprotein release transport system permease subunit